MDTQVDDNSIYNNNNRQTLFKKSITGSCVRRGRAVQLLWESGIGTLEYVVSDTSQVVNIK